ncbi:MAG TPA: CbiQ family ECF transporter T component [Jatrophihabitans sp.]|uniref:CbiQ family ECF transporter T component n=1 Tax=Jatrophihabitans sp. TaxID=1932789 RepID=UPI002DFE0C63|nr:CbiQ family ECF transporter T component [Jatrophihabitans sp.]
MRTAAAAPVGRRVMPRGPSRLPRALHPVAWWVWAIGLATAVSRTTNPLLLVLVLAVLGFVIASRRTEAPWARAFKYYLWMAVIVIAIRVVFRTVFASGAAPTDHVLFTLPTVPTPHWYAGVHLGGPVSLEALLASATDGLRLGTMLCCIGAANALANPKRALRVLPGALYELGVAVVVAVTVAPQLIESVQRVRRARRLRAGQGKGLRALRGIAIPVLEDALERSLRLAAAMDSRGYGRTGTATRTSRRVTGALLITGLLGLCAGVYGLLDPTTPHYLGLPAVLVGGLLSTAGLALGGRRITRTTYRPDPWRAPEWVVAGGGVLGAALLFASSDPGLSPTFQPLAWPTLPLVPVVAILLAALAGVVAPPPVAPAASRVTPARAPVREQVPA